MSFDQVEEEAQDGIVVELCVAEKVNFASAQNGVSVVTKLLCGTTLRT